MSEANEILGGSKTPSFFPKDDTPGHTTGWVKVIEVDVFDQTNANTGEVEYWPGGTRAKKVIAAKVQTDLKEDVGDDGVRAIYFSGQKFTALKAVSKTLDAGDEIKVTYTGLSDRKPANPTHNPAKLYSVEFRKGSNGAVASALADTTNGKTDRPDSIPESVWNGMPATARDAVLASLGSGPA